MEQAINYQTYELGKGNMAPKRLSSLEVPSSGLAPTRSSLGPYKPNDGMRNT